MCYMEIREFEVKLPDFNTEEFDPLILKKIKMLAKKKVSLITPILDIYLKKA